MTGKKVRKKKEHRFKLNEDRDIYLIIFSLSLPGKHQTYKTEQRSSYTHNSWNLTTRNIFFHILYMRPLPGADFPALGNGCRFFAPFLACVVGVNWGRDRGKSGARGGGNSERLQWRFKLMFPIYPPRAPLAPSRARIHVFPSPVNACHAGASISREVSQTWWSIRSLFEEDRLQIVVAGKMLVSRNCLSVRCTKCYRVKCRTLKRFHQVIVQTVINVNTNGSHKAAAIPDMR